MIFAYIPLTREEGEVLEDTEELKGLLETCSTEDVFYRAKKFMEKEDYTNANIAFGQIMKRSNPQMREIARTYIAFIKPGVIKSLREYIPGIEKLIGKEDSQDSVMDGMINAMELYEDGILPEKELEVMNRIVDRFPFDEIETNPRFDKVYLEFKEYVAKA